MVKLGRIICILFTLQVLGWASTGSSKGPSCPRCGCCDVIRECHPVVTTKLVTTDYWDSATQSFCVPHIKGIWPAGHGHAKGYHGKGGKPANADTYTLRCDAESRYGAKPRCRNRLIRKTCVTEVPVLGWVTHYVCPQCGQKIDSGDRPTKGERPTGKQACELPSQTATPIPPSMRHSSTWRDDVGVDPTN
jgi:hypothetical protein